MENVRNLIPATARGHIYASVAAIAPALIAWGILDEHQASAVIGVVTAVVTLLFAVVHGTSNPRNAAYGLLGAATIAATAWGYGNPEQWETILAIAAPALGLGIAGANTPTLADRMTDGDWDRAVTAPTYQ